jgi:hypothetical protein
MKKKSLISQEHKIEQEQNIIPKPLSPSASI